VATSLLHIFVILTVAIIYLVSLYVRLENKNLIVQLKILTASTFLIGLQDLFVIVMLWLVMDSENKPIFKENHHTGELY